MKFSDFSERFQQINYGTMLLIRDAMSRQVYCFNTAATPPSVIDHPTAFRFFKVAHSSRQPVDFLQKGLFSELGKMDLSC